MALGATPSAARSCERGRRRRGDDWAASLEQPGTPMPSAPPSTGSCDAPSRIRVRSVSVPSSRVAHSLRRSSGARHVASGLVRSDDHRRPQACAPRAIENARRPTPAPWPAIVWPLIGAQMSVRRSSGSKDGFSTVRVPLMGPSLCAGFPSPADDFVESALELPRWLVPNPPATFLWRIAGDSMRDAAIFDGNLACVIVASSPHTAA